MPEAIALELDDRELNRRLRRLKTQTLGRVISKALNRTAFEVLEAERAEARRQFAGASPRGQEFLGGRGSFRFQGANPGRLYVEIFPNPSSSRKHGSVPRREQILKEHARGAVIVPDETRLTAKRKLAVPVGEARERRQRTGRVPKRLTPAQLLSEGARGFIAGSAILIRKGRRGRGRASVLYALVSRAKLEGREFFFSTARRTAGQQFPMKAREEFRKAIR